MRVRKLMGLGVFSLFLVVLAGTSSALADAAGDHYDEAVGQYNAAVQAFSGTWRDDSAGWGPDDVDHVRSQLDAARELLAEASYHLRKGRREYGDGIVKQAAQLIEQAVANMASVREVSGAPAEAGTEESAEADGAEATRGPMIIHAPSGN